MAELLATPMTARLNDGDDGSYLVSFAYSNNQITAPRPALGDFFETGGWIYGIIQIDLDDAFCGTAKRLWKKEL